MAVNCFNEYLQDFIIKLGVKKATKITIVIVPNDVVRIITESLLENETAKAFSILTKHFTFQEIKELNKKEE